VQRGPPVNPKTSIVTREPSVLLVEDSPDDAYFFNRALRLACVPCSVTHVSNGREAVNLLVVANATGAKLPDVIFLDLKMPVMSGFDVLEWLQQQSFASGLKVFVLSGSNQQDDRVRAQALGASGYLVKPICSEDLSDRLRAVTQVERITA
jgi:CheY-like chemotaxis protein